MVSTTPVLVVGLIITNYNRIIIGLIIIVTESNCSHCFVCTSLGHGKSVCPQRNLKPKKKKKKKNRVEVAQERHCVTHSKKPSSENCCVCKTNDTTL